MARRDGKQELLFPVHAFIPKPYKEGSLYDMLEQLGGTLFPRTDFPEADSSTGGRTGWCPVKLTKLVLLQTFHGWTDREAVRRASMDLQVKACLGFGVEQRGPSQPTLCRHRQRMQELKLDKIYAERLQHILETLELVGKTEAVLVDSVPVHGAGQHQDTYNLLASAVRKGLRELAVFHERDVLDIAREMNLEEYADRSIKGRFKTDWSDSDSRVKLLSRLVEDGLRVRNALEGSNAVRETSADNENDDDDDDVPPSTIQILDDIIAHDVERDEEGTVLGIVERAAGGRLISVTDPDMRHGRKSASKLIAGFKAQIVASVMYGFILLARLIPANEHDGEALPKLVSELATKGLHPLWWGGDHAYGTIKNHQCFADMSHPTELVARMARPTNGGRFLKDDFTYDFDKHALTCPSGHILEESVWKTRHSCKGRLFVFPSVTCHACPMRKRCVHPKTERGRSVFIVDERERLIRGHLKRRKEPEFLHRISHRPAVERVIAGFAQCGGKQAHRFGKANVRFDVNLSALAYNLRRIGSLSASNQELRASLAVVIAALLRALQWLERVFSIVYTAPYATRHAYLVYPQTNSRR